MFWQVLLIYHHHLSVINWGKKLINLASKAVATLELHIFITDIFKKIFSAPCWSL